MIEMEQEDYHQPIQNLDVSLDQAETHNELLLSLYQDQCTNLLNNYQNVLNDKDTLDRLKKDLAMLDSQVKETFLKEFCQKISQITKQIIDGKQDFKKLKQSGLLQFLLLAQLKNSDLTREVYQTLHRLLQKQTDSKNFMYLFKIIFKIAKHIQKRQTLIHELINLSKDMKQNKKSQVFQICQRLISEDGDLVLTQQKYLLLLYITYYLCSSDNPHYKSAEQQYKKLSQIVKQKPLPAVLDFILKNQTRNKKLTKQLINSQLKVIDGVPKYIFSQNLLHTGLETRESYLKALLNYPQKIFNEVRKQNFIEVENKIYPKINIQTLKKIAEQSKLETGQYTAQNLQQLIQVIKFFLKSNDKKIASFTLQTQMQEENTEETCDRYLIYCWAIFAKYYYEHERNSMSFDFLAEKLNTQTLNLLLNRCLEFLDGRVAEKQAQYFAEELIKIVIHLLYKTQYSSAANYTSETSKLLEKVLLKTKQYPYKWRNLKKINAMLDKWAQTCQVVTANITQIMNKFLNTFFDPKTQLKSKPFSQLQLLNTSQFSKNLVQLISNKVKEHLKQYIVKIQQNSQNQSKKQQQYKKLSGFLYKLSCLYITRMKIPDNEGIADLLFQLYQMNSFYVCKFRTWILYYSNKSKDHVALKDVTTYSQQIVGRLQKFKNVISNLDVDFLLKPLKKVKQSQSYPFIKQFFTKMQLMINNLQLKRREDIFGFDLFGNIFHIIYQLNKTVDALHQKVVQKISEDTQAYKKSIQTLEISQSTSIFREIAILNSNLVRNITFYLFNVNTLLDPKDQLNLLTQASQLIKKLSEKNNLNECNIKLINDLFGHNQVGLSHLEFGQILESVMQRNGIQNRDQFYFNKEQYAPLMIVSVVYARIRPEYSKIVKNLLQVITSDERALGKNYNSDLLNCAKSYVKDKQKTPIRLQTQAQTLISNIVFPSINIFGSSFYNNKVQQKGRQEEGFAILHDQFSIFYNGTLSPKQITLLSKQLVSYLTACKDKQRKIINKQVVRAHRNPRRNFGGGDEAHRAQLITSLGGMGFEPDVVQYAIQQLNDLEPQAVMNWLQINHDRIDEIRTRAAIQRSKSQTLMSLNQRKSQSQQSQFSIPLLNHVQFIKSTNKNTKQLIKKLYPEFFSDYGTKIKDLIFVCLDSFQQQQFKNKQLTQFSQAMYKQIEGLKNNFSMNKLMIAVSSLQNIIAKKPEIINKMHENSIPLTLLSFLDKADQKAGEKILSVINCTLPNPTQNSTPLLKQYINYIGDVLIYNPVKSQFVGQLLLKMSKTKDVNITKKILEIICKSIQTKSFQKQKLFPILNLILDTEKQLITANIELDIKNYILENTDLTNNKDRFIKIDNKKFGFAFVKYEDNPSFAEVANKILVKKNGKLSMEILQHNLYASQILGCTYFDLKLSDNVKIILQSIINQIVKQQDKNLKIQYIRQLHKILQFYRILIPFCLRMPIENQNLTFFQWLIQKQFPISRGNVIPFITFLFTQNGLFINSEQSYTDYLTSLIITKYIKSQKINKQKWSKLLILYLLHIKSFYNKNSFIISPEDQTTLKDYLQAQINPVQPINYLLLSESIYLILKQQIIEKLSSKYRIEATEQTALDKQFLNMELFYMRKKLSAIVDNQQQQAIESRFFNRFSIQRLIQRSGADDLGDQGENIESFLRRVLMMRERDSYDVIRSPNINSIFVPIQPPSQPAQQPNQQAQQAQQPQQANQPVQQPLQVQQASKQKKQQEKKPVVEQMIAQQTKQQKYLSTIIQKFQQKLLKLDFCEMKIPTQIQKKQNIPPIKLTQKELKDASYHTQLKQPKTILQIKVNKTAVFRERISQIAQVIDPEQKWVISDDKKRQLGNSNVSNGNNNPLMRSQGLGGYRRNMINRLMGLQRQRQNQPPAQTFNVNRLLNQMQEYQQPKQPEPKKQQQKKKQQNIMQAQQKLKKQEQKVQEKIQQKIEQQKPVEKKEQSQMKQQKQQKKQQKSQQKMEEQKPKSSEQKKPVQVQSQKKQQKVQVPSEQKKQQKMQEQKPQEQKPKVIQQQVMQPQQPQQSQSQQQEPLQQQQPQIQPVIQQMVQQVPEPHRQILQMYGLPQTFLRDLGINAAQFDMMPEDIQMQQIHFYMENQNLIRNQNQQQQRNQQQQNQNNPNNPNQNQNQNQNQNPPQNMMTQLQMQNAAFIQSLDPQLRAQTLMQATPDFLMTLPPAMRAEAANYRQRQIAQMLREQQMQMEHERINQIRQPKVLIYPELTEQNFPQISHQIAQKISKGVLIKMPKFRLQSFKLLIQNKKTQKQAINTLICFIKNVDNLIMTECKYNKQKKQWEYESNSITGVNRKVFIQDLLNFIEQHINNCIYKDQKFLSDKDKYHRKNYSGTQLAVNQQLYGDADGYYPVYQLIEIAIQNHQTMLLNKLIKKVTKLPKKLRKKVVKGIRQDKFTSQFYYNLQGLSKNQKFKQAFMKQFSQQRPIKVQTLSKLLKYDFSKLPYLKKLHIETLKKYKGSRPEQVYDFLNQIYSSYTVDDIKQIEQILLEHKQTHFYIIKYIYQSGRSLDSEPIKLILKFPHLLDFQTKRYIFQKNPKLHKSRHRCVIEVDRTNLFQQSFNQIMSKTAKELEGSIKVVFMGEQAEDAGGPRKQWYLSLSKAIFDPHYALFQPSSSGNTYQPNPKSYVNTEHLSYFKFIGRFFAKALCEDQLIDAFFTRSFYKMILGHQLQLKDLQQQDYSFYKSMLWLKQTPFKGDQDYTYSYQYDYFGKIITKELVPGGENIKVTEENKADFIHKYSMAMMRDSISAQIGKFLQGFYQILPRQQISFFEPAQLQLLMSGMPSIDLKDLQLNTDYQGYSPTEPIIKWYWQILEEYTNEQLAKLVQFITGTSKIPLQGFAKLKGMHGPQKISIHKDCHIDQLPKSHTCFNQLDLPNYPTKQILKQRLRVAITWGSEGFGFM